MSSLLFVGGLLTTLIPLGYSILVETRFVKRSAIAVYGCTLFAFGLAYLGETLPELFVQYQLISGIAFILLGAFFVYTFLTANHDIPGAGVLSKFTEEDTLSLVFSAKVPQAFQLVLLLPVWIGTVPQFLTVLNVFGDSVLDGGLLLSILAVVLTVVVRLIRKFR